MTEFSFLGEVLCLIRKTVLFDSIVSPSLYWGVRTHTDHRVVSGTRKLVGKTTGIQTSWRGVIRHILPKPPNLHHQRRNAIEERKKMFRF